MLSHLTALTEEQLVANILFVTAGDTHVTVDYVAHGETILRTASRSGPPAAHGAEADSARFPTPGHDELATLRQWADTGDDVALHALRSPDGRHVYALCMIGADGGVVAYGPR